MNTVYNTLLTHKTGIVSGDLHNVYIFKNMHPHVHLHVLHQKNQSTHYCKKARLMGGKNCARNRLCKLKGAIFFTQKFKFLVALPQPRAIVAVFESLLLFTKFLKDISLSQQCELISLPNGKHNFLFRK